MQVTVGARGGIRPRGRGEPARYRRILTMQRTWFLAVATSSLIGCGDVQSRMAPDAGGNPDVDASAPDAGPSPDAATGPCAPAQCLLYDDFSGASLNKSLWVVSTSAGATVTQAGGKLTIRLPAAADAFADVSSTISFPVGTALEATVTLTAGQVFDHKGVGFASGPVSHQCTVGETDAAMFRGQDGDGYIETKLAAVYSCNKTASMYTGGTSKLEIARMTDQVVFRQNDVMFGPIKANLPTGPLPVRFSAYTYTMAPTQPVQIDVDYVIVKHL
jgi:hypothetical protein